MLDITAGTTGLCFRESHSFFRGERTNVSISVCLQNSSDLSGI